MPTINYTHRVFSELDGGYIKDALVDLEGKVYYMRDGKLVCTGDQEQYSLERFTGLYDKNQHPIFERDLLTLDADIEFVDKAGTAEWEVGFVAPRFFLMAMLADNQLAYVPLEDVILRLNEDSSVNDSYTARGTLSGIRGMIKVVPD